MNQPLSPSTIEAFHQDGVVLLPGVIDRSWQERLAHAIERDIAAPAPCYHGYQVDSGKGGFHGNMRLWETDEDFAAYCADSPLPAIAAQLLAVPTVRLYYDQLFVKEAAGDAPTRWHNDQPYWPIRGGAILSCWVTLDPVRASSGGLRFVRGSHRWDRWFQPEPFAPGGSAYARNPAYEAMPDIDATCAPEDLLGWDMAPGDVVIFHALTVHGALANQGSTRRRAYTVRYCGPRCTYYEGPGTSPYLQDEALDHGDTLRGARYPVVWPAADVDSDASG